MAELPEGWRLPSILTALTQFAQIGPLLLIFCRVFQPNETNYVKIIYYLFLIGSISCICLAFTWNKTVPVLNEQRSLFLYLFNFTLSILGKRKIKDLKSITIFKSIVFLVFSKSPLLLNNQMASRLSPSCRSYRITTRKSTSYRTTLANRCPHSYPACSLSSRVTIDMATVCRRRH